MTRLRKTGLVFFPAFDWAISPTHPEREERLLYTQDQVFEEGLLDIPGMDVAGGTDCCCGDECGRSKFLRELVDFCGGDGIPIGRDDR